VKIISSALFFLFCFTNLTAQDSLNNLSVPTKEYHKTKAFLIAGISAGAYGASLLALNQTWYRNFPKTSFHTFNDSGEWLQTDKIGHAWSAYGLSRSSTSAWRWTGLSENKSVLIGTLTGFSYLTVIEFLDAHSEKWGWSWADMAANVTGSSLFALQQLAWKEQRIQFKFSAHKKKYIPVLDVRANELFGKSLAERILKDYNGQAYWLSFNLNSFTNKKLFPDWLNLSIGYGADGMFGGYKNIGYDKNGNISFDRTDIKRYRQWYFSPDIDFTKIKTRSKFVRTILAGMNAIKLPAPALELSNGKLKGHWFYF
jgi:uncharacterized protein YfiM (DUF2279 family)